MDGGALLLPYIEASGQQSDYSAVITSEVSITRPNVDDLTRSSVLSLRMDMELIVSGDLSSLRVIDVVFENDREQFDENEIRQLEMLQTLELVASDDAAYGRSAGFDKWIDITSVLSGGSPVGPSIIPLQATQPDSDLANVLFELASGSFDPRDIEEIEAELGKSPLVEFKQVDSLPDRLAFVYEIMSSQDFGSGGVGQFQKIAFRVDAATGLITLARRIENATVDSFVQLESSSFDQYEIDYSAQVIDFPQPGDPSIETDPEKIRQFLELFE